MSRRTHVERTHVEKDTSHARPPEAAVEQRRKSVLSTVLDEGEVRIDELARKYDVSLMTMHRDVNVLVDRELVRKLRGCVKSFPSLTVETATRFRETLHVAEKEALARAVLAEFRPGMTVIIDDSSTMFPLAAAVRDVEDLTVVTNSVRVARTVGAAGHEVVLVGGRYRPEFDSCTGPDVLRYLSRLRVDLAVMSATTISRGRLFHPIQDFCEIKSTMCEVATRSLLLVDHSKFGRTATHPHGDVSAYDLVITEDIAPVEELDVIHQRGVEVQLIPTSGQHGCCEVRDRRGNTDQDTELEGIEYARSGCGRARARHRQHDR